ncbi:hypothetical protein GW17_00023427 [Ensete ventricosum]|nr:hypothetical protein GW17_00023427 [Ensete ventricosum]RZS09834.1 hypothetical protein BHM03_00040954 [Ensete ventricosum]
MGPTRSRIEASPKRTPPFDSSVPTAQMSPLRSASGGTHRARCQLARAHVIAKIRRRPCAPKRRKSKFMRYIPRPDVAGGDAGDRGALLRRNAHVSVDCQRARIGRRFLLRPAGAGSGLWSPQLILRLIMSPRWHRLARSVGSEKRIGRTAECGEGGRGDQGRRMAHRVGVCK